MAEKAKKDLKSKKVTDNKTKKEVTKKEVTKKVKKEEKDNKVLLWFKDNSKPLIFGLVGLVLGLVIMGCFMPGRVAKLSNGKQVVLELKNGSITAEDLFEELKKSGGLTALINLMDNSILDDKYDLDEDAEKYAKEQSEYYYKMYSQYYGLTKEQFLSQNNFEDEAAFFDYLKKEFLYQRYYEDYLKSLITDAEVEDYYNKEVFGARTVYVFSSTKEKNSLESVRKQLKKGTKISKLEDKYEDVVVNELGEVDFTAATSYSEEFISALKDLKANQYSKVFKDSTFGYVVLYVSEVKDVPALVDAEDKIIEVLSQKKDSEDETLYYKAFQELREAYGMKFYDEELEKQYNASMKPYLEGTKESE